MQTIQIVLDKKLLKAIDQSARQMKRTSSAACEALRQYL
jgi:predicted transcriptional regulator